MQQYRMPPLAISQANPCNGTAGPFPLTNLPTIGKCPIWLMPLDTDWAMEPERLLQLPASDLKFRCRVLGSDTKLV